MDGTKFLTEFCEKNYQRCLTKVNDRIYHFLGYGHSNATVIIGNSSVILVDALDSDKYALEMKEEIKKITNYPVKTIIYTHGHPDHMGGAGAFETTVEEVIKMMSFQPIMEGYDRLSDILKKRGKAQHGYELSDEEAICQGIGIREGKETGHGKYHFLTPSTLYNEDKIVREIDGITIELYRAVGEADDGMVVWLPEDKVICVADNYYACWPNTYAIRGTSYRDVAKWINTLNHILSFPSRALLPGHSRPLLKAEEIQEVVGTYRDALISVWTQTLSCMNQGLSLSETVEHVQLEDKYKDKEYLQECYGTVEWTVKGIYTGYLGWFDTDPVHLLPLSDEKYAKEILSLIGDSNKVIDKIQNSLYNQEYQLALQLLKLVSYEHKSEEINELKKEALKGRAEQMTSANARHYYYAALHAIVN